MVWKDIEMTNREILRDITIRIKQYSEERIVIHDSLSDKVTSYKSFSRKVKWLVKAINEHNVQEIILKLDNSEELLIMYFVAMFSGIIIIPVDPEKEDEEICRIKRQHPNAMFVRKNTVDEWMYNFDNKFDEGIDFSEIVLEKSFLITYTSGSTGNPKGVVHSFDSLFLAANSFGKMMCYDERIIMGHCMPMTYMAGILNTIILPFIFGGTIVLLPRFSAKDVFQVLDGIRKNSINAIWFSPMMLRMISLLDRRSELKEYFHRANIKISVGTAPLDIALRKKFESKYDVKIYQSYGLSETLFLSTEISKKANTYHTVGYVLPEVTMNFLQDGEISVDVPWMFKKYIGADNSEYFIDNFYLTGDLGMISKENLLITGRKKEIIVKGGYNINPYDIENLLIEKGIVLECAVVSVVVYGEERIVVYCVAEKDLLIQDINKVVCEKMGKHYRLDFLKCVNILPKNLNGKIDRMKIKKDFEKNGYKI